MKQHGIIEQVVGYFPEGLSGTLLLKLEQRVSDLLPLSVRLEIRYRQDYRFDHVACQHVDHQVGNFSLPSIELATWEAGPNSGGTRS